MVDKVTPQNDREREVRRAAIAEAVEVAQLNMPYAREGCSAPVQQAHRRLILELDKLAAVDSVEQYVELPSVGDYRDA